MSEPRIIDLLVVGGTILTLDGGMRVLEDYSLAIDNGKIIDLIPPGNKPYQAKRVLDARNCLIMPGLINTHTHLPMTYFRGLADDLPLDVWLREYIWPLETKLLDHEFILASSLHGAAEMIKNGITQIHDMYFDMPAIADACAKAGLRALIGEAVLDVKLDAPSSRRDLGSRAVELRDRYRDNPLLDFDLAPHSLYGCSRQTLEACARAASDHNLLLHTHLSETRGEAEQILAAHGVKPVFYLKQLGLLDLPAVYAHSVWLDEDEIELLASAPASVAMCTECNLKLASGILPLKSYLDHGVNVTFATDGVASNNNLDLLSELDVTAKLHKAVNNDPAFLPAEQAVRMATRNAAQALGCGDRRGSLVAGKDADLIVLSLDSLDAQPFYNPYSHVVYALGSKHVRDVVIAGRIVLERGELTQVDEVEIVATAREYKTRILESR